MQRITSQDQIIAAFTRKDEPRQVEIRELRKRDQGREVVIRELVERD